MKLLCFLLTFVLVSALADEEAECKKQILLANAAFKRAYHLSRGDVLERVIESMVNFTLHIRNSFAKMNFKIAVPDKLEIINDIPGDEDLSPMKKCSYYQYNIQRGIIDTLNVVITGSDDVQVIAYPEADEGQDFGELNLETLGNERREYVAQALRSMFRRELGPMYDSFMSELELKIRDTLTDEVQDLGGLNLTSLAEKRRVTGTSLENTITRVLGKVIPDVAEVQYESYNFSKDCVPLFRMCRLMALYISTQYPTSYIRKLQTNSKNNSCTLWDGRKEKIFRKINGIWEHMA
ncbi:uncharacterized protein LOC126838760 [Adelges cooleyi]|uniref:uncharacterized protein LOC126838760 n=1 Tax=Adelges cooleyi TaxID=133065 RepID=UPI0021808399|nr:uncharacterized protein LOC126838760 [Adelges cooleyi]